MVLTRSQKENLTIGEFDYRRIDWGATSDIWHQLSIKKDCNTLLHQRIIQLERNVVNNAQYLRRESLEVNPVPCDIGDSVLEETVCRAISLTRHEVTPDDLHKNEK